MYHGGHSWFVEGNTILLTGCRKPILNSSVKSLAFTRKSKPRRSTVVTDTVSGAVFPRKCLQTVWSSSCLCRTDGRATVVNPVQPPTNVSTAEKRNNSAFPSVIATDTSNVFGENRGTPDAVNLTVQGIQPAQVSKTLSFDMMVTPGNHQWAGRLHLMLVAVLARIRPLSRYVQAACGTVLLTFRC